jgi:hypothetical protein
MQNMEGTDLKKLIKKYDKSKFKYKCLIEAVVDHEMSPGDPLTSIILKGAIGIADSFWYYSGNLWRGAVGVRWDNRYVGDNCVYIEVYGRKKIKEPITEIRFVSETNSRLILPERNPLILNPSTKIVKDYFEKIKAS